MIIHPSKSMRPIRALGIVALSALVLSLAPPVAGVGWAAEPADPAAGSVAPGKLRDTGPPPPGVTRLSKPTRPVSSWTHQKKAMLGLKPKAGALKPKAGTMSAQDEGGTCSPFINWIAYDYWDDYLEEATQIDFGGGVSCDVTLDSMLGTSRIVDRTEDFNGQHFDGEALSQPAWFWEFYSTLGSASGSVPFSAHDWNGGRYVEGVLELQLEAPAGMTWSWCWIGLCSGLGTSSLQVLLSTGVGWTGLTRACRDQSAPLNDVEIERLSRPAPGTTVWASSQLVRKVPAILGKVMAFKRDLCSTSPGNAESFATVSGLDLWETAVAEAKKNTAGGDDRPLYWARLHMMAALRQWRPVVDTSNAERGLDRGSRGMTSHSFSGTTVKKAFVSGFDPFGFDDGAYAIMTSNPSAAAVLRLDGKHIGAAEVQAVIFPVRYADFDAGLVEEVVNQHLVGTQQATVINTVSQGDNTFELEFYYGRRRASQHPNEAPIEDNRNEVGAPIGGPGGTYEDPKVPAGPPALENSPEFIASSLPFVPNECAVCRAPITLVLDTHVVEQAPPGSASEPKPDGPTAGSSAVHGSGEGFLSNELPYRVTLQRDLLHSSVPAGHVHTPALGAIPDLGERYKISGQYERILTELLREPQDTTPTGIGISFTPDGDAGQCGNPGQQWVTSGWTTPIRLDTDNRTGGCQLTFGINDPRLDVTGLVLSYRWQVSPGGDARQCGNQDEFQVPITSLQAFGPEIRVDADDKTGWCNLTFTMSGRNDFALDIQFWPDGNAGQCVNYLPQGQYRTVQAGTPVTIGINTDGRSGGCKFSLRLRRI
jgi:hypothetical protein